MSAKPLVVCIAGPTATGKTAAAVAVAQALDGEIISMDSMQLYKGFDVGTAKPSGAEMGGIPHHMLSCVAPDAAYSAAMYQRDASAIMQAILAQGKLPIFCGGTGLYLQAVSHPLGFTQAGDTSTIRAALERQAEEPDGIAILHDRLKAVDPDAAARLHPNNTRRVIRALEVYETTGIPMSAQTAEWEAESEQDWLIFALTWPREVLYARIEARVDEMIVSGLEAEVAGLLQSGVPENTQAMQAIGYKEIVGMLREEYARDEAIALIKRNTRRYAKRQLTWLRRDARVRWVDVSTYTGARAMQDDLIRQITTYQEHSCKG